MSDRVTSEKASGEKPVPRAALPETTRRRGGNGSRVRAPKSQSSFYNRRYAGQAAIAAMNGASDAQLADFFDISLTTFNKWRVRHEDFKNAIINANDALTPWIERSFAHRALGYEYDEEKVWYDAGRGEVIRAQVRTHVPPDVNAAKHWLERCGAARWKAQPLQLDIRAQVRDWSADELAAALQRAQETLALEAQRDSEGE